MDPFPYDKLFDFQLSTVLKLKDVRGALIGHDMGTGKTVTAIALDSKKRDKFEHPAKTLVVCPLAVVKTWENHFRTWAPHLKVASIDNKNRKPFMEAVEGTFKNAFGIGYDVFIIHYAAVRLEPELARYPWFHVIADEVHALQDRKSAQTKAVKKLQAFYKTGLSGTPVFHKPDDLWSILNWLYPKYWTSYWNYFKRFIKWVEYDGYRTVIGVQNEEELQKIMAGFFSRVKKRDVLKDLPDKYYSTIKTKMHPKQEKAYKQMKKDMLAWVGEHENEPINAPVVLAQLTRLQQFASAYAEVKREVKRKRNCEDCKEWAETILVNGLTDKLSDLVEIQQKGCLGHVDEHVVLSEPSCKIDAVIEKIQESDEPIVVFSQFAQMAKLLKARCDSLGIPCGLYTGSVPKEERDKVVEDFQEGKLKVFAGSIKAGGMGLTLTKSSNVIILNRDWVESLNEQAIDRVDRIGQKNAIHVIDIVTEGSVDEERNLGIALDWQVIKKLLGEL